MAILLPLWPKRSTSTTTTNSTGTGNGTGETTPHHHHVDDDDDHGMSSCCALSKLVKKLKKRSKKLCWSNRHQSSSFQCRYDPMSYSLNFDTTGSGGNFLDEDYYKFYAFSSRFVPTPTTSNYRQIVQNS